MACTEFYGSVQAAQRQTLTQISLGFSTNSIGICVGLSQVSGGVNVRWVNINSCIYDSPKTASTPLGLASLPFVCYGTGSLETYPFNLWILSCVY